MRKKLISLNLVIAMIVAMLPTQVWAEQASGGDSGYATFYSNTESNPETIQKEFTPFVSSQAWLRLYQVMPVFERDGYAMTGYNSLPNGSGTEYEISEQLGNLLSTNAEESSPFYAQWTPVTDKHVLYVGGQGTTAEGESFVVEDGLDNTVTLAGEETFLQGSKKVIKWATKPDQDRMDYYAPGETISLANDLTLFAVMGVNSITLHYKDASGDKSAQKDYYSSGSRVDSSSFYGRSYTDTQLGKEMIFLGWSSAENGSGAWYSNMDYVPSEPRNLYAQYASEVEESHIIYSGNGAVTDSQEGFIIQNYPGSDPGAEVSVMESQFAVPEGKLFLGWNTRQNGWGTWYMPGESLEVQENTTLYAIFGKNVVFYHLTDSDGTERISSEIDLEYVNWIVGGVADNKISTGLNTRQDGTGTWYGSMDPIEETGVFHLYKQWEPLPPYYYVLKDWKLVSGKTTEAFAMDGERETVSLPLTTGGDRTLFGWYDTTESPYTVSGQRGFLDEATNIYAPGATIEVESGNILTALSNRWGIFIDYMSNLFEGSTEKRTYYAVTSNQELQLYTANEVYSNAPTNKTFTGWNTAPDGSGTAYSADDYIGDGYYTLYAQWQDNSQSGGDADSGAGGGGGGGAAAADPDAETTVNPDGSTTTTITDDKGNTTSTTEMPSGVVGTTTTNTDGTITSVESKVPSKAIKDGETVTLPIEVPAVSDADEAAEIKIDLPANAEDVKVEIPVEDVTPGTVAIIVNKDGTEEIVKLSAITEDGVVITLDGDATVKIVDNSREFDDVHDIGHWSEPFVDYVVARGLFSGTGADTFSPDDSMTCAMLMTVLASLDSQPTTGGQYWYSKGQEWAVANGISDGTNPNGNITREQMIQMLYRYAQLMGLDTTTGEETNILSYADSFEISDWAYPAMQWAIHEGLISGMDGGVLNPMDSATRAQVATILKAFSALF